MVSLECSPFCGFQTKGYHVQVHGQCLQDGLILIKSFNEYVPAVNLYVDLFPVYWGDPPFM